jgi:hypothetical protein
LALRQGNSDPFATFPVAISSKINAFMTYTRELYLPGILRDALNREAVIDVESHEWADCVSALQDSVTAYAYLARIAAAMTPFDQKTKKSNFGTQLLVFKSKGTGLLRKRIESGEIDHMTVVAMSCYHLAAVHAHEYTAARSHARALVQIFQRGDVPTDHMILHRTIAQDGQMATTTLERPAVDVEGWVSETMIQHFASVLNTLPPFMSLEASSKDLDASIENTRLRDVLGRLRQCLVLSMLMEQDPMYATFEYKHYVRYVVNSSCMTLVNHYLDSRDHLDVDQKPRASPARAHHHVQAYASLATILWLRKASGASEVGLAGTPPLFDANALLMRRLNQALEESKWMAAEDCRYANVRLWALYVGAYQEQVDVADAGARRSAKGDWFNVELALLAKQMGLVSWERVREPLLGFLHADHLMPHGSEWFMHTIEASVVDAVF